jgi:hypothetical protein
LDHPFAGRRMSAVDQAYRYPRGIKKASEGTYERRGGPRRRPKEPCCGSSSSPKQPAIRPLRDRCRGD